MYFIEEGPRYKSDHLFLAKHPRIVSAEKIKIYEILVPLKLLNNMENPYLKTIELMYDALTIFFTTTYRTVTPQDMQSLWNKIDLDKLLRLPYPASLPDQKYVADVLGRDGKVVDALEQFRQDQFFA